jgi:exopolysaccharide production protein ExoY
MHSQETPKGLAHHSAVIVEAPTNTPGWKRAMDVTFIVLALPVILPVGFVIASFIKIVSRGPIFFKQERVGYRGTTFLCFKFRSMRVNAETTTHQNHTTELIRKSDIPMVKMDSKGDKRLIPFGGILRATGLDELPQLINVWKGEMSLVGPRPCTQYEYEHYLPWQKERFDVVPGLTGLWQVSGKNQTTFNEMIRLDIRYGKTQSPWLDFKIIVKTLPALFEQVTNCQLFNRPKVPTEEKPDVEGLQRATSNLMSR